MEKLLNFLTRHTKRKGVTVSSVFDSLETLTGLTFKGVNKSPLEKEQAIKDKKAREAYMGRSQPVG